MKLFHSADNCHLNKVLKTFTHPSISLIVLLLASMVILPSFASAEIRKEYYPSGKLKSEENYINGKKEGISKWFYESGKLDAMLNFKNGKREGINKWYNKSGKLHKEFNYKNDKLDGISKLYYESGGLKGEANYKNDKLDGIFKQYYKNGKLEAEANHHDGKLDGIFTWYFENGEIRSTVTYEKGRKTEGKTYEVRKDNKQLPSNDEIKPVETYKKGQTTEGKTNEISEKIPPAESTPDALDTLQLTILGFLPGIIWLIYFYRKDSVEPEPTALIFKSYFYGIIVIFAGYLNPFSFDEFTYVVIVAPIFEEFLKFMVVYLFIFRLKEFDEPMDGIIYAVSVALGFASIENAFYMYNAHKNNVVEFTFVVRSLLTVPGHALFSSIWGYALGIFKFNPDKNRFVVTSLFSGMLCHAIFNYLCFVHYGVKGGVKMYRHSGVKVYHL